MTPEERAAEIIARYENTWEDWSAERAYVAAVIREAVDEAVDEERASLCSERQAAIDALDHLLDEVRWAKPHNACHACLGARRVYALASGAKPAP